MDFFDKQRMGIGIVAASWVADEGKPDHPAFWNTCCFELEDGTYHRVSRDLLADHDWYWTSPKLEDNDVGL